MEKLQMTDRFIEIIDKINYDVERITYWNYGDDDTFLMGMRRDLDIMRFKLQWKIFEHIRPNGDIDVCLDKSIHDKELRSIYKLIMHSDIPTWREIKDELLEKIPNLAETRNYVQWYKTKFAATLSNVLDVDDFRNNPNHNIIKRIEKISPDVATKLSLTHSIDNILVCLNNWVKEFAALMDEWWSGAPEISNQKIELVTNLAQDKSLTPESLPSDITEAWKSDLFNVLVPDVFNYTNMDEFYTDLCSPQNLKINKRNLAWTFYKFGFNNIMPDNHKAQGLFKSVFKEWETKKSGNTTTAEKSLKRALEEIIKKQEKTT